METCVVRERFVCLVLLFGCCAGESVGGFVGEMRTGGFPSRLILCSLFQGSVIHSAILRGSDISLAALALDQPSYKQ